MKQLFTCCLLFLIVFSCKKKNDNPVIVVNPYALLQYGNPGEVKDWNISITSDIKLSRLIIYTQIQNDYEQVYKDTSLSSKNLTYKLQYLIPAAAAGKLIYFRFRVIDEDGNEALALKEIQVGDQLLTEFSGLQFNSRRNINNNAFDLELLVPSTVGFSDSTTRDLQEYTSDTASLSPSYFWYSPAGGQLVYANSYDYANATLLSTQQFFNSSTKYSVTDSLVPGNIYITKLGSTSTVKYLVIKVVSVTDASSTNPDYYTFNIKR